MLQKSFILQKKNVKYILTHFSSMFHSNTPENAGVYKNGMLG